MQQINKTSSSTIDVENLEELVKNNLTVHNFKRQSKLLYKKLKTDYQSKGIIDVLSLSQCQDIVAQQHGYKHWHEFHTHIKKLYVEKYHHPFLKYGTGSTIPSFASQLKPFHLGYNNQLNMTTWLDKSYLHNNILIEGTFLYRKYMERHLLQQGIQEGNHIIYFNGGGDSATSDYIIQEAKKSGREQDIRTISFMTNWEQSHTTNWYFPKNLPFGSGGLAELIIAMIDEDNDIGTMWKGRAIALISALMMALVYMRDNTEIILSFDVINDYLQIGHIIKLSERKDFPSHIHKALKTYLELLPNFSENLLVQPDSVLEHHGYLQMQLVRPIGYLGKWASHLFKDYGSIEDSRLKLNELWSPTSKLIFIINFSDFSKAISLNFLSHFVLNLIKNNMSFYLGTSLEGKNTAKSIFEYKLQTMLFIHECPISKSFAKTYARIKPLKNSFIFSLNKDLENKEHYEYINNECDLKFIEIPKDDKEHISNKEFTYRFICQDIDEVLNSSV